MRHPVEDAAGAARRIAAFLQGHGVGEHA
jgi:hypothetical protein